jgi:hypothetical protein
MWLFSGTSPYGQYNDNHHCPPYGCSFPLTTHCSSLQPIPKPPAAWTSSVLCPVQVGSWLGQTRRPDLSRLCEERIRSTRQKAYRGT